jgi:peptidoglycan/xylan/chitin deacetylase (PgdA/CDA1 family)
LLSFDVEEFDIPEEYGQKVNNEDKISISLNGFEQILTLLDKHNVKTTIYCTAVFALANAELIRQISATHEIASHGYYHSSFKNEDIAASKNVLDKISEHPVKGYRMARLAPFDETLLVNAGYTYNSSLNPTWLPGRYNHLNKPRLPFIKNGLFQIPASVTAFFRLPLFWISFKMMPYWYYRFLAVRLLKQDGYLNIYFHPWEFTDISKFKIPFYTKKLSGKPLIDRLEKLIITLKSHGEFVGTLDYCVSEFNK